MHEKGIRAHFIHTIGSQKSWFLVVFLLIAFGNILILADLGLLPEKLVPAPEQKQVTATTTALPETLSIPSLGLSVSVSNPESRTISVLDAYLREGAVRYPTSAVLGEDGNVVIFGHSSYLPVVLNEAYKTFNGIQTLVPGDRIFVASLDTEYEYQVVSVQKESAEDAGIPLAVSGRMLTLSTCDSFGTKSDRFVVYAEFVAQHAQS